jgi:hypothetical protein
VWSVVPRRAARSIEKVPSAAGNWARIGWQLPGFFCSSDISQIRRNQRGPEPLDTVPTAVADDIRRLGSWGHELCGYQAESRSRKRPTDRTRIVNEQCLRIKIVASKTRAAHAPSGSTFIRAAILTRDVAIQRQSGVPVSRSFQHATEGFLATIRPPADRSGRAVAAAGHRRGRVRGPARVT